VYLSPDAWIDSCGASARGLRGSYVQRGSEDELWSALTRDPRRLVVIVGEPGAGASRLALELSRRAPRAWYPDPLRVPHGDEGLELDVGAGRPVVVLDGPIVEDAVAPLEALLTRALHPRLLVIVPIDSDNAPRVPLLAGGYPRASIAVVSIEAHPSADVVEAPDALLPFALLGRAPAGRFEGEPALRERGLLSAPIDGEVVCLAGERARRLVVARASRAQIAELASVDRRRALEAVLRFRDDAEDLLEPLTPEHVRELTDPVVLMQRGVAVPHPVAHFLASSAERLLVRVEDGDDAATLLELLAREAARNGDSDRAVERLREAESRAVDPRRRARLLVALGVATNDDVPFARAVEITRKRGDEALLGELLRRFARALDLGNQADDALSRADESAALEEARGSLAGSASARMLGAAIARSTENTALSIALARRAHADRLRIGDARGALRAAQFLVTLLTESGQHDDARAVAGDALQLAEAIGDGSAEGYLRWVLGALADRSADPRAAAEHYQRALAAYRDDGAPIPERLIDAVRAAELADDTGVDPLAESRVRLSLIPPR